ncbi:MAG: S9 family peptidase [Bacteroidales bacterium]|nr:S9 family peptidase [Bacteroidales bacterium]
MRKTPIILILPILFMALTACNNMSKSKMKLEYPVAQKDSVSDNYFGTIVQDPYRWLEDDNSEQTAAWVDAENAVTNKYLDAIPFREDMRKRLETLWNYPKFGTPFKKGDFWYFYKNDGMQAQYVIYQMDSVGGEPRVFLDPNSFSEDGTVSLANLSFSEDGNYAAYSISRGGSDWNEVYVYDVLNKKLLDDHINWVKFSGMSWLGNGFYYGRFPEPVEGELIKGQNTNQQLFYHQVGTSQDKDIPVYSDPKNPSRMYYVGATKDETILLMGGEDPNFKGNALYYKKIKENFSKNDLSDLITIDDSYEFEFGLIGNIGDTIFVKTNQGAPKYRIMALLASKPEAGMFEIIPESEDVLMGVQLFGDYLLTYYLHDAASQAFVYNPDGKLKHKVELPEIGSIGGFGGDEETMTLFYTFNSFTIPGLSYNYDIETNTSTLYQKSLLDFDMNDYETKQVFYKSKDGTSIPMFLVYKKGIELNGKNPTMLYGYGGFNISLTPSFSVDRLIWLEQGGIYAQANLRGGGEYGEEWHLAGTRLNKQNVFDDFIAAADYLIQEGYTSTPYLAISGRSNGGLLVGACMTQRPDLFRVAFPGVGVLDMLRYHKFTIGHYWSVDYGTSDDSVQFANLIKYSPLHNLKEGVCYPSTFIVTADHDDRVFPAHSFKFAAALQAAHSCENPVLIRIDKNAGHGAGKPTAMYIADRVDMWSFAFFEMGITPIYPKETATK